MAAMSHDQIAEFLRGRHHAILATTRADGSPLLSPVWYLYENDVIYAALREDSLKHRALLRDPRIAICVDAGYPTEQYVAIYGSAAVMEEDTEERRQIFWRMNRRYYDSDDEARHVVAEHSDWKHVLVAVTPSRITGVNLG
jgi:PPOX class probable F420-dependent enzyme